MSANRVAAVAVVVVLALFAGAWRLADSQPRGETTAATHASRPLASTAVDGDAFDAFVGVPGRETANAGKDPIEHAYRAGQAWYARWRASTLRLYVRWFGPEIGALFALPIDEAWAALEARLAAGEAVAADALQELACPPADSISERFVEHATEGLDARAAAFVRGALEGERAAMRADAERCALHGLGEVRLAALARAHWQARGEAPPAWLFEGTDVEFGRKHGRTREYVIFEAAFPPTDPRPDTWTDVGPLVARVLHGSEAGLDADDWISLIAASDLDPGVAWTVGPCAALADFCTGFPPLDADTRRGLVERSAQAGNASALNHVISGYDDAGDLVAAYAWTLYLRWTASSGCAPMSMVFDFADASKRIAAYEARLGPGAIAAGRAEANRLIAAHGARMRGAFGCPS